MTKQPTLPPFAAKATAHLQRVNKARNEMKMAKEKLLVKRQPHTMNQEEVKVLGHTDADLIELLQCLELGLRFDKDSGFPISMLKVRLIKKIRALLTNSKGEGV